VKNWLIKVLHFGLSLSRELKKKIKWDKVWGVKAHKVRKKEAFLHSLDDNQIKASSPLIMYINVSDAQWDSLVDEQQSIQGIIISSIKEEGSLKEVTPLKKKCFMKSTSLEIKIK